MYTIEVNNVFNQIFNFFYFFRIWRHKDESQHLWKVFSVALQVFFSICFICGGLLSDDRNEAVFSVAIGLMAIVETPKLVCILWKRVEIQGLMLQVASHSIESRGDYIKVTDKLNQLIRFSVSLTLIISLGDVAALTLYSPLFSEIKRLPLDMWFPLSWERCEFIYWIAYCYCGIAHFLCGITVLLNAMIWYLMLNCAISYEILGNRIKKVTEKTLAADSKDEVEQTSLGKLINLMGTHLQLRETVGQLTYCFASLFLVQITTSGILICGVIYALAFTSHNANLLHHTMGYLMLVYVLFDIFMIMYFGNEIKLSSERMALCLFESGWINESRNFKMYLLIFAEVLKRPHELVVGKLYPLTLNTFLSILRFSYSMFNVLLSLN